MENYSLSDIAAVTGREGNDWCGGGNYGLLFILVLFFLFAGGGMYGNRDAVATQAGQYQTQAEVQRGFDNSAVINKLDGISNGICDSSYALNNAINQGFASSNFNTMQGFNGVNAGICNLGHTVQSCCCETNRNIDAVRYENAKNTCDIINANNANTQRIIDTITNNTIQDLRDQLQSANLQLGNLSQTSTIINAVRPTPIPAYLTCSPYQAANYNMYGSCGNLGCGCYNV